MRDQNASRHRAVADLATRQHGRVAHWQLLALGLSTSGIHRWAGDGRLHRVNRAVYAVGHGATDYRGRWMAAVLACGPGAVLSHRTAAAHLGLRPVASAAIHVTTPRRANVHGVTVHQARTIHAEDRAVRDGIPVTSVARTALDCAQVMTPRELVRLLEQAERLGLFDLVAIERVLARNPRRRGAGRLRAALAEVNGDPPRVNSPWERDLLDFCVDHGIPKPELNVIVEGYEVDALWRKKRLIVELDSWTFHRSRRAFVEDRRKTSLLQLASYMVLPITALDDEAARLISAAVAAR
jgi:hypothetical protein